MLNQKYTNENLTFSELIQTNVPLHDKNWFKTGGPAKYYCEPSSEIEFQEALAFARTNNLDIFVLGQGANILISDEGFDGLVICPKLNKVCPSIDSGRTELRVFFFLLKETELASISRSSRLSFVVLTE